MMEFEYSKVPDQCLSTKPQDIDLIEVLWRQDMDLGVGREMFDVNLRKELEKEQELQLQKERENEKEIELLQEKLAEDATQNTDLSNYILDNETGELIPVSATSELVSTLGSEPSSSSDKLDDSDEGLSVEEAMRILEEQDAEPVIPLGTPDPLTNLTEIILNQENTNMSADAVLPFSNNQVGQIQQNYQRQSSFEQHWEDIATYLNLPPAAGLHVDTLSSYLNDINVSLPHETDFNNSTNQLQPDIYNHIDNPSVQLGSASFVADLITADANNSLFDLDSQELMFPQNQVTNSTQSDTCSKSSALLLELLSDDVSSLELPQLVDGLGIGMQLSEGDTSSDSAVSSIDSVSSSLQDIHDINGSASVSFFMGPGTHLPLSFDGSDMSEGASSAHPEPASSNNIKYEKIEMDQDGDNKHSDFSFPDEFLFNQSISSNDNDTDFKPADMHHLGYHLKSDQQATTEPYIKPKIEKKNRVKSRDEMKAKMLKIPLTVDQIINTAVEEFNELVQKYTLTETQLQLIRDIRRRGKNKVAAQNCRKRKLDVLTTLEDEVDIVVSNRNKLIKERSQLEQEMTEMRRKFQHLYQEVLQSLRDENGQPYDPAQYSLQQSPNGGFLLIPNSTICPDSVTKVKSTKKKSVKKSSD